jgi:hypothetical protein
MRKPVAGGILAATRTPTKEADVHVEGSTALVTTEQEAFDVCA